MACLNDTDGDGDCHLCVNRGGCFLDRCYYCDDPAIQGQITCGSEKCLQIDREMEEERIRFEKEEVRKALKAALECRCKDDGEYGLNSLQRWFYTVKLLLCVLFRLRRCQRDCEECPVNVCCYYHSKTYGGWQAGYIVVGHGVFKSWFYDLENDGDSSM